jgi:hypothetical protein
MKYYTDRDHVQNVKIWGSTHPGWASYTIIWVWSYNISESLTTSTRYVPERFKPAARNLMVSGLDAAQCEEALYRNTSGGPRSGGGVIVTWYGPWSTSTYPWMENATAEVRWNERVEPGVRVSIRGKEALMGDSHDPERVMSVVADGSGRVIVSIVWLVMVELKVIWSGKQELNGWGN